MGSQVLVSCDLPRRDKGGEKREEVVNLHFEISDNHLQVLRVMYKYSVPFIEARLTKHTSPSFPRIVRGKKRKILSLQS